MSGNWHRGSNSPHSMWWAFCVSLSDLLLARKRRKSMKYEEIWKKTLNDSEKVDYEFSVAPRYRMAVLIVWAVIGLVMLLSSPAFGVIVFAFGALHYWKLGLNAYAFTSKRVLVHTGWLSTKSTTINYDKIVEVSVDESYFKKALTNSGNLVIKTAGLGHDIILKNIATPYEAKKTLDRLSHHDKTESSTVVIRGEANKSASSELIELFKLKEQGAITDEEFQAHKAKLLK